MTSIEKLVRDLEKYKAPPQLVDKAKEGYYNDVKSPVAFPIVTLVRECRAAGLHQVADAAVKGEYDATTEEWDEYMKGSEFTQMIDKFKPKG